MTTESRRPRIGIVDDDPRLVDLVTRYLTQNGFPETAAFSPSDLLSGGLATVDLLILDVMMPDMDGFELLRRIRETSQLPILFLTARSEVFDRVVGLELGADDYLTKPFEPRELLARISAVWRRKTGTSPREPALDTASLHTGEKWETPVLATGNGPITDRPDQVPRQGVVAFEEFVFDLDRQTLSRGGQEQPLTSFEYHLLRFFCQNHGIVLTRHQIIQWLERCDFGSYDRSIDVGISRLRKKVESDHHRPSCLKTVWGRGYQLVVTPRAKTP